MNNGNGTMGRESFLAAARNLSLKTETVPLPEIGGAVTVRELTAGKATSLGAVVRLDDKDAMLLWVIASVIDEDGNLVFTEADLPTLREMNASIVLRIGSAAVKLTGLGGDTAEALKNSAASPK